MRTSRTLLSSLALATLVACGGDDTKKTDTAPTTTETDATTADGDTTLPPTPDYFPEKDTPADEDVTLAGLADPVRVVYDNRGIPHIYGKNVNDLAFAQGYVTARDRMFQMHTLRSAARGRLAEYAGNGNLSGDFFLRLLKLGSTAVKMAAYTKANDPELDGVLEAYAAGVNKYLERLRAGLEHPKAAEITIFGDAMIDAWTPADTMEIVRLQTWDLGFGGVVDELDLYTQVQRLRETFAGTPLDGIWLDVANFEPNTHTATMEPEGGAHTSGSYDLQAALDKPFFNKAGRAQWAEKVRQGFKDLEHIEHHQFRGEAGDAYGSNDWVISGAHTASGKVIVSNDTHLSLRNPAIFNQVHLSNALAGGNFNAQGVMFAGAPGIVLGHNDSAAWGGTVHFTDVTDLYVETLDATKSFVTYDGQQVAVVKRDETFLFAAPANDAACVTAAPSWVPNLAYTESKTANGKCQLVVTFLDVPHHGPIVPWSIAPDGDGFTAMAYKWTGFDATDEMGAVWRLNTVTNYDDFKAALDRFGVGAQNWVYGDVAGNIGWYPSHLLPIRKHIAAGNYDYPPFLPMPGDTSDTNWVGFVPRSELPQAYNPAKGFLVTANGDPTGTSFDNDPFNDGNYIGYAWDVGYRVDTITSRIKGFIDQGHKVTREDMKAIQADHTSRLGKDLTPALLAAVDLTSAVDSVDASGLGFLTSDVLAAVDLLRTWDGHGYQAESGVGAANGSADAQASAATAIFNAWTIFLVKDAFHDEGLDTLGFSLMGRFLSRVITKPETMASYDEVAHDSPLWDDQTTAGVVETRAFVMLKALKEAVTFLADPGKVGPKVSGGFGTSDMNEWRWGKLHTVTLKNNLTSQFDIPSPAVHPNGYERHGDNYVVDASNPGFTDTNFTYASGAAIRNVYEMLVPVEFDGVIPGGQSEISTSPHYADEAELWSQNLAPKEFFAIEDVIGAKEKVLDLFGE